MKIFKTECGSKVTVKFEHPDTGCEIFDLAIVADMDDIQNDYYTEDMAEKIWEQFNHSGYWHTMTVTCSYTFDIDNENKLYISSFTYNGYDLEHLPTQIYNVGV